MYYWFDQAEDRGGQVEANAVSNIVTKVLTHVHQPELICHNVDRIWYLLMTSWIRILI